MVGKSVFSNEMLLVSAAHQRGAEAAKFHGSMASLAGTALSPFCPQIVSTQSSLSSCFRIQLFMAMVCVCVSGKTDAGDLCPIPKTFVS